MKTLKWTLFGLLALAELIVLVLGRLTIHRELRSLGEWTEVLTPQALIALLVVLGTGLVLLLFDLVGKD